MKSLIKLNGLLSLIFLFLLNVPSYAVNTPIRTDMDPALKMEFKQLYGVNFNGEKTITAEDILYKSQKEIAFKLNTKLNWKQKLTLKFGKYRFNKIIKSNDNPAMAFVGEAHRFHFLSFILGFFFSIIGVLLSWLFFGRRGLRSSLYGVLFGLLLYLLAISI